MILGLFVKAGLVMLLWNYLVPDLFHGPVVVYPQALGLMILAKLLVGFHGFGRHRGPWGQHHCHGHGRGHWRMHMSREEREKFRQEFRRRGVVD